MSQYCSATSVDSSESYSDNASHQDTASKQHHSRIEITTKNMIDHMLSEQLYILYSFHTCHTWDLINIKMLSRQYKRLVGYGIPIAWKDDLFSVLYPQWDYFLPYGGFVLYWISTRLHLLNTNTERWHQLQNKLLWNDSLKAKPKCQPSLGSMSLAACAPSHPIQRGVKPLTGDLPITVPSSVPFKFWKLWPTFICTAYGYICR